MGLRPIKKITKILKGVKNEYDDKIHENTKDQENKL